MTRYFNRTRGPATVSLKTGESALVAPKAILEVTPAQDGSASIHAMVRRNILVKLKDPVPKVEKEPKVVKPEPPKEIEEVEEVEVQEVEVTEEASAKKEVPSLQWTKTKMIAHAESLGVELPSSWTKVDILKAIKGLANDDH